MNPHPKSQKALFYAASRNASIVNQDFCWLMQNGMTQNELRRNIERRPSLWGRFANFLTPPPKTAS